MEEYETLQPREALESSAVFSGLAATDLDWVLDGAVTLRFDPGKTVLRRGDPSDHVLIVLTGSLVVETGNSGAGPVAMNRLEPGDLLGELGVLHDVPRTATVKALEPCELLKIPQSDFLSLLVAHPALAIRMLGIATDRLRHLTDRIEELTLEIG